MRAGGDVVRDQPIVFISHFAVRPGHAEAFRSLFASLVAELEVAKPATMAQVAYLSDDASRLSIVHVFPDADAVAAHFLGSGERSTAVYEHIVPAGWEMYGSPHESDLALLRSEAEEAGVRLAVWPEAAGGFFRATGP
jgi:quinol monooxygenase YgiN